MPDMLVKLYELPELAPVLKDMENKKITIRRTMAPEKYAVGLWVQEHFSNYWKSECEIAMTRQPSSCLIATIEDDNNGKSRMLGFACYDSTLKGFFGPTGVAEETRGMGVGKALLIASLHAMREEGYGYAVIGGAGPVDFYAKFVGAEIIEGSIPGVYQGMLPNI